MQELEYPDGHTSRSVYVALAVESLGAHARSQTHDVQRSGTQFVCLADPEGSGTRSSTPLASV